MISQLDIVSKFNFFLLKYVSLKQSIYNFTILFVYIKIFLILDFQILKKSFCCFSVRGNLYENCNLSDCKKKL